MTGRRLYAAVLLTLAAAACGRARQYELRGQIVAMDRGRQEVTVKHDDIRGFMPGMTMPFKVRDARLMEGRAPGDLIRATLVVEDNAAYLSSIERIGHAPVTEPPSPDPVMDLLEPGEEVPDATFVDQSGTTRRFSGWRGHVRAVTFMYTRCPLPNFCPLMDRHFAALQRAVAADPALTSRVRLTSITIDPEFDTPRVLAEHARALGADPAHWSFLTGERGEVERFALRFGVSTMRDDAGGAEIVHNLRTAIVDADGRLVKVFGGNDWTPAQVLAELKSVAVR